VSMHSSPLLLKEHQLFGTIEKQKKYHEIVVQKHAAAVNANSLAVSGEHNPA
jgi:hypothetical protein